jgi:uncharacterized coiled-coil protein SlyX
MADTDASLTQVDQLLQQRAKYEQWLARLDGTGTRAPEAVRQKVRADYEARLRDVLTELRTHVDAVETALAARRETVAGLDARRADVEERLAEAEVRHAVGEYNDDEWSAVATEAQAVLDDLAGRLGAEQAEIARLSEVQRLMAPPAPVAPAAPAAAAPPAVPVPGHDMPTLLTEPVFDEPTPSPTPAPVAAEPVLRLVEDVPAPSAEAPAGAPKFVPRTPMPSRSTPMPAPPRPAAAPVDELAFLKSVTGEEPRRARAPAPVTEVAADGAAGKSTQQKTLRCGECGTLNRATEWYCERCGAELAAL